MSFETRGFSLIGLFDNSPSVVGQIIRGLTVQHIDTLASFCDVHHPKVAVLCLPFSAVEQLSNTLVNLGIRNFWNFSHYDLSMQFPDVVVENVHMSDSLMTLCYRISNRQSDNE